MSKDGQVARAKHDLAQSLGVPETEVDLKSVREKDWPDASLGVKQPGMSYAQMIVSGYVIDLQAGNHTYRYHADEDTRVVRAS